MLQAPLFRIFGKKNQSSQKGAVIVETAIVTPLLAVLFMGIWEFGYFLPVQQDMINIAKSAMRQAASMPSLTADVDCVSDGAALPSPCESDAQHVAIHNRVNQLLALHGYETLPFYQLTSRRNSANDTVSFSINVRIPTILTGIERTVATSVTGPYLSINGAPGTVTETGDIEIINKFETLGEKSGDTKWGDEDDHRCGGKWCQPPA